MATTQSNTPTLHSNGLYLVPRTGPYLIHCPRPNCPHVAHGETDGKATRNLAHHLVHDHMQGAA